MGVNGRFSGIGRNDLLAVADRFQVPAASRVLGEVAEAVAAFPDFAREAGLPETRTRAIQDRLLAVRAEAGL
jgi:serine/threonine-protein kinase HipA